MAQDYQDYLDSIDYEAGLVVPSYACARSVKLQDYNKIVNAKIRILSVAILYFQGPVEIFYSGPNHN